MTSEQWLVVLPQAPGGILAGRTAYVVIYRTSDGIEAIEAAERLGGTAVYVQTHKEMLAEIGRAP